MAQPLKLWSSSRDGCPAPQESLPNSTSLRHKVFVCDCPRTQLYHEDVMAAAIWQRGLGNSPGARPALSVRTVLALTSATRVVSAVPVKFTQETIVHTFKAWCPFVTGMAFSFR